MALKKAKYLDNNGCLITPETLNAYKLESFIFDYFEYLKDMRILRVKRDEEYATIKNATGIDSPETAIRLYMNYKKIKNKDIS